MKTLFFVLLMGSTISSLAQLTGKVTDKENGDPIPGAIVTWKDSRSGTSSDENGVYSIGVPPNAQYLIVNFVGYDADTLLFSGESRLDIQLSSSILKTVVVKGEVSSTKMNSLDPQNFQTLDERELCKAACCNLSESFETNASIDASFTDAITGTRQIRMLGLDGRYTQINFDNVNAVRGLASVYGLSYVPGPFVHSIQIGKGSGSVLNGFESITGQINVSFKNPANTDPLYINGYLGTSGRSELNVIWRPDMKTRLRPLFLVHGAYSSLRSDMNNDGFMDNPLFSNLVLRNEWHLESEKGLGGQYVFSYMHIANASGKLEYDPNDEIKSLLWGVQSATDRYEFSGKTGYVFREKDWKSFGSQLSASWHDQVSTYGFRTYNGEQMSARANLLFATRIVNNSHKITTAISYVYDDYKEILDSIDYSRLETAAGAAFEYTLNHKEKWIAVFGLRGDVHNSYGFFLTPRIHTRYSFSDMTTFKMSAGKGYRSPNIWMDNVGNFASNRIFAIIDPVANIPFGLKLEEATNVGAVFTHKFKLGHRDGTLSVDAYRTWFQNQVVMDIEEAELVRFYNLDGASFSNTAQVEANWSPVKRFEVRLAYRWLDVQTQFSSGLKEKPLVAKHRAFTNFAYETKATEKKQQWRFDVTAQWISSKRIPQVAHGDHLSLLNERSNDFVLINAQVTYVMNDHTEFYLGGENLTNFMQHDPIISAQDPSDPSFDASLIWGPVFGSMAYVGFRWKIASKENL
ncbi:MAG: TonB-dependent receptor [Flavobacteriales bacterium]|nr:TonB-dependent receptor [Flavobacteriales bacterium]